MQMKKFLQVAPFFLVFLVVFALHVRLDVVNQHLPFLEPFGRESAVGVSSANRQPQVLGENRFAWLAKPDLVIGTIDPADQKSIEERRPAPAEDLFASTNFRLAGDEIFWIGDNRILKRAAWQNGKWSAVEELGTDATGLALAELGRQRFLLAGTDKTLKIWKIAGSDLELMRTYPMQKPVLISSSGDRKGVLHIAAINQLSSDSYEFYYLTLDTVQGRASDLTLVKTMYLNTSSIIDDMTYGIDQTHGYMIMTYKSGSTNNRDIRVWSYPLANPTEGQMFSLEQQAHLSGGFTAYAEPGQQESLRFAFTAEYEKNPRVGGREVFLASFKSGVWQDDLVRVSNTQRTTANPVFFRQGDTTTVVFTVFTSYNEYKICYNSNDPQYAKATNVLTKDDYINSALQVPQYLGMIAVLIVLVIAWPALSYTYLIWFLIKREDDLYDRPDRHFAVAWVLYVVMQVAVFLIFGKFDNIAIYGPEWMQSRLWFTLLLIGFGLIAWGFAALFGRIRYERNALAEFNYFFGLNTWLVTLVLSYFMAT
jgi:hypothetical protein